MKLTIVKVGGAIVEDEKTLQNLLRDFSSLPGPKVLVHGGGRSATQMAARLGIESHLIGGRRVTDRQTLDVVTMVYGGLVNKRIVAGLQACGTNAVGLTGADMDVIRSHRRPVVQTADGDVDYGFVGDVDRADGDRLHLLISAGITPVMAPLTHDGHGQILNTNADTIASATATALSSHYEVTLVYCFEKPGVLRNADDDTSVIPLINAQSYEQLKADGTVSGGMLPKLDNAFAALRAGVTRVVITQATALAEGGGTVVTIG